MVVTGDSKLSIGVNESLWIDPGCSPSLTQWQLGLTEAQEMQFKIMDGWTWQQQISVYYSLIKL